MDTPVGKIYWISDEFSNRGRVDVYHNLSEIYDFVAKIDPGGVNVIEFKISYRSEFKRAYIIRLEQRQDSSQYKTSRKDLNFICSRFENENQFMLYGDWEEEDEKFKCWVIIDRKLQFL